MFDIQPLTCQIVFADHYPLPITNNINAANYYSTYYSEAVKLLIFREFDICY